MAKITTYNPQVGQQSAPYDADKFNVQDGIEIKNSVNAAYDALDDKVDKVAGKELSENDYTDAEKAKLGDLPTNADLNTSLASKVDKTTTVAGKALSGNVTLAKGDVGLGNVDNTSDANKPVSTAQQTALDDKANASDVTTALAGKQDTLTPGDGITIVDNVISAPGGSSLTKATTEEAEAGTDDDAYMTPLKTAQAIYELAPAGNADVTAAGINGLELVPPASGGDNAILNEIEFASNSAFPTNWVFAQSEAAAEFDGVVESFFVELWDAESGRTVNFYVLEPQGGLSYKALYKSANISAEADGVFTYTPVTPVGIPAGCIIGARVNFISSANSIGFYGTGGPPIADKQPIKYNDALSEDDVVTFENEQVDRYWGVGANVTYTSQASFVNNNWRNLANGFPGLDENSVFPNTIGRAADMGLKGKKIVWVGTSIPARGNPTYPEIVGQLLSANVDNEAVGESGICWDESRAKSLSATIAELTAEFPGNEDQSYENKIIGKDADLVVFDHGFNDRGTTIGAIDSTDKSTLMGAFNHIITAMYADNPLIRFCFITPPTHYDNAPNSFTVSQMDELTEALKVQGAKWNEPVFDMGLVCGTNAVTQATYTEDGLHQVQEKNPVLAQLIYGFLKANY